MKNMLKGICALACHPDISQFAKITETLVSPANASITYINRIEMKLDEDYATRVFDSCKQVIHPASGGAAMALACGTEVSQCDPEKLYFYMGDPAANPLVPFKTDYVFSDNPDDRFTADTKLCEDAYEGDYSCSCVDCEKTCPPIDPPSPEDPGYLVFNLNGITFFIAIAIGSFGVVSLIFGAAIGKRFRKFELPKFLGGFEEVNTELSKFFCWWGRSKLNKHESAMKIE